MVTGTPAAGGRPRRRRRARATSGALCCASVVLLSAAIVLGSTLLLLAAHAPPPTPQRQAAAEPSEQLAADLGSIDVNATVDGLFRTLDRVVNGTKLLAGGVLGPDGRLATVDPSEMQAALVGMRQASTELSQGLELLSALQHNETTAEGMRGTVTTLMHDEVTSALIQEKLIDLRAARQQQAQYIASQIALSRDRLHFSLAFYICAVLANGLWVCYACRLGALPLSLLGLVGGAVLLAYNVDAAYGTKAERLNVETQTILRTERHWFNEPMTLPPSVEPDYRHLMAEVNKRRGALGFGPEADWAVFSAALGEEVWRDASPLSRIMHSRLKQRREPQPYAHAGTAREPPL